MIIIMSLYLLITINILRIDNDLSFFANDHPDIEQHCDIDADAEAAGVCYIA